MAGILKFINDKFRTLPLLMKKSLFQASCSILRDRQTCRTVVLLLIFAVGVYKYVYSMVSGVDGLAHKICQEV